MDDSRVCSISDPKLQGNCLEPDIIRLYLTHIGLSPSLRPVPSSNKAGGGGNEQHAARREERDDGRAKITNDGGLRIEH